MPPLRTKVFKTKPSNWHFVHALAKEGCKVWTQEYRAVLACLDVLKRRSCIAEFLRRKSSEMSFSTNKQTNKDPHRSAGWYTHRKKCAYAHSTAIDITRLCFYDLSIFETWRQVRNLKTSSNKMKPKRGTQLGSPTEANCNPRRILDSSTIFPQN